MSQVEGWSTTAANNNASAPDGFPEGQTPASLNNCARELMAATAVLLRQLPWINLGFNAGAGYTPASITRNSNTQFQFDGIDLTAYYTTGRRVRIIGAATQYAYISSSSFSTNTTVNLTIDGGASLTTSITEVDVSIDDANTIGTAAQKNTGTSSANIPTISNLLGTVFAYTRQQYFTPVTLTDGATINWNLDTGQLARVTIAGLRTLANPTNMRDMGTHVLEVKQGSGGGHNITSYGTAYEWVNNEPPDMSGAAVNEVYVLTFQCDGTKMRGGWLGPFGA